MDEPALALFLVPSRVPVGPVGVLEALGFQRKVPACQHLGLECRPEWHPSSVADLEGGIQ